jgi:antitoxin component of RelBE/YafQ-DinJ toxin-antitoxin module
MSTVTLTSINIDTKVKRDAMRNAKAMGLQFSTVVNGLLRTFNMDRRVTFELPEIPNAETAKSLHQSKSDWDNGRKNYMTFESQKNMDEYLMNL